MAFWNKHKKEKRELQYVVPYANGLQFGKYSVNSPLSLSAIYCATELISNSIAIMPIKIKQTKENAKSIISNHSIINLFNSLRQTKYNFIKSLVWDMLLYGNSFAYIVRDNHKNPIDLIYLQNDIVSIEFNQDKQELYYLVSGMTMIPNKVEPNDMLHFYKNTRDGFNGIGILQYAKRTTALYDYTESAASDYFGSGCNIKGILKFGGYRDDAQKEAARSSWNEVHGNGGSGIAVMDADCDFLPISQSAAESQMIESRKYNIQEVARFFNINPVLLQDLSNSSYSTIEAANIEFVEHTLLPYISLMEEELNRKLITKTNEFIDLDETVLLKGDKTTMANYIETLKNNGIITTNEARAMLDLNPIDGGDDLIIPFTNIADNVVNESEVK